MSLHTGGDCQYVKSAMLCARDRPHNRPIEAKLAYGNATMFRLGPNARFQDCASALISRPGRRRMGVDAVDRSSYCWNSSAPRASALAALVAPALLLAGCGSGGTVTIANS